MLPSVLAYHPEISLAGGLVLKATLPDFVEERTLLGDLARRLGVATVGEIVQTLQEEITWAQATLPFSVSLQEGRSKGRVWGWHERVA